jgi:hypothetical protein
MFQPHGHLGDMLHDTSVTCMLPVTTLQPIPPHATSEDLLPTPLKENIKCQPHSHLGDTPQDTSVACVLPVTAPPPIPQHAMCEDSPHTSPTPQSHLHDCTSQSPHGITLRDHPSHCQGNTAVEATNRKRKEIN